MVTRLLCATLGILILPLQSATAAETVVRPSAAERAIVIYDLVVQDGSVSGSVVNKSSATVHDVELLVRQMWLWNDELHPGSDSPGRALPFMVRRHVTPYASAAFALQTPPLPQRADGRFVTTVEVSRFSEVGL